jgi:hypothetical protein
VLLLVWYLSAGRVQVNYLREKYGSGYSRNPWGEPLRAGAGAIVGFVVLTSTVGLMFRTGDEVRRAVDPTAAPPPRSVAGSRPGAGPAPQETRSAELGARGELGPGPAREALEAWKLYVYQRSKQLPHPPPAVPRSSLSVPDAAELAEFEQQLHLEAWKLYLFLQRKRTPAVAPVVPRGALSAKSAAELAEYEQQLDKFK